MTRVGIVAPMRAEARTLSRRARRSTPVSLGAGVRLALAEGIGPAAAVAAAKKLLEEGAAALIIWGTAGALDPTLAAGDLLLPERILDSDGAQYRVDPGWRSRVCAGLDGHVTVHAHTLLQSQTLVATADEKQQLHERLQAAAVDMESAALARLAGQRGLPFLAVRAIVDTASTAIPPMLSDALDESGRLRLMRLLRNVCLRPGDLSAMFALARGFHAARTTLESLADSAAAGFFISAGEPQDTSREDLNALAHPCNGAGGQ